jgi:AraC-like DNA-binding protein
MVANIDKLKGKITENRYTMKKLSEEFGMTETTLRRKINDEKSEFSVNESWKLKKLLNLTLEEYLIIFFNE